MTGEKPKVLLIENWDSHLGPVFDLVMEKAAQPDIPFALSRLGTAHPVSQMEAEIREELIHNRYDLVFADQALDAVGCIRKQHQGRLIGYGGIVAINRDGYDTVLDTIFDRREDPVEGWVEDIRAQLS